MIYMCAGAQTNTLAQFMLETLAIYCQRIPGSLGFRRRAFDCALPAANASGGRDTGWRSAGFGEIKTHTSQGFGVACICNKGVGYENKSMARQDRGRNTGAFAAVLHGNRFEHDSAGAGPE
jgi:hypothetical protein